MWRVLSVLVPEKSFSPFYKELVADQPYPALIRPRQRVEPATVMGLMRDFYEGTPFDASKGLKGGASQSPDRWAGGAGEAEIGGAWE